MKKIIPFLFAFLPLTLRADSFSIGGKWSGLNDGNATISIGDNEAQDLLNVDITENAFSVKKRAGYTQFNTIGTSTWGVRGGYYFTDSNNVINLIHTNNSSIFTSKSNGAYTAIVTTDTAGSYYDFADANGALWRATSNNDEILKYNGTAVTYYPSLPKGNQIEILPDRLVISGVTTAPGTIYFSKAADFTTFTTGLENSDAFTETLAQGNIVKAIKYFQGSLLIWTENSMWKWSGTNQFDAVIEGLSNNIGTVQPYSVTTDLDRVYWQGQDKHFYMYDGSIITKISGSISNSVSTFNSDYSVGIWNDSDTTSADFLLGTLTDLTTSTVDGDLYLTMTSTDIVNPGFETGDSTGWDSAGTITSSYFPHGGTYHSVIGNATIGYSIRDISVNILNTSNTILETKSIDPADGPDYYGYTQGLLNLSSYIGKTIKIEPIITIYKLPTTQTYSIRSNSFLCNGSTMTFYYKYFYTASCSGNACGALIGFDDFSLGRSTITSGSFLSQTFDTGLSSPTWGATSPSYVENGQTITFQTQVATSSYGAWDSLVSWTPGNAPTSASKRYIRYKVSLSTTSSGTGLPYISEVPLSADSISGNATITQGSVDNDHRVFWSLSVDGNTINNRTFIFDPRFSTWLKYDVPFDGVARVGKFNYFGGVSTGVVYKWPVGETDNNATFTSYWKSKDFISGDPFTEKEYLNASLVAKSEISSNLDIVHTVNTTNSTSDNFSLIDSDGLSLKRINYNLPNGTSGTFINFQFGNDDAQSFEVFGLRYDYRILPWRVLP